MSIRAAAVIAFFLIESGFAQSTPGKQQQIDSHARQAQEFLKANRPDQAAREFQEILALDPDNIEAHANLGVILSFQGAYEKAVPELRRALELRPTLWNIQALLGTCERRSGQAIAAKADLEKAFQELREPKLRVQAGMELVEIDDQAGELDQAAAVVAVLRQLQPANPDILYAAHRIYSNLADESMLALAMNAPKSARMHQVMAQQLQRQGDAEGAIAHYREALKLAPKLSGLHFELGEVLGTLPSGEAAQAEKEYRAALADNPFDEKSECRLGEIAFRDGDLKAAFEHYSRALSLQPDDADAGLGLGKTLASMHQPEKAKAYLERAAQAEPFDAVIHYRLASVYRDLGQTADAHRELSEFEKLKEMKDRLKQTYHEMRLRPGKEERSDPDIPK